MLLSAAATINAWTAPTKAVHKLRVPPRRDEDRCFYGEVGVDGSVVGANKSTTSATPSSHARPTRPMPGLNDVFDAHLNMLAVGSSRHRGHAWPRGLRMGL